MYVWIDKSIVVNTEDLVAIVDAPSGGPRENNGAAGGTGRLRARTMVVTAGGRRLYTGVGKEAVVRKIKRGVQERTWAKRIDL